MGVSGLRWWLHWLMDQKFWAKVTPDESKGWVFSLDEALVSLVAVGTALLGGRLITMLRPVLALAVIGLVMALGALTLSFINKGYRAIDEVHIE